MRKPFVIVGTFQLFGALYVILSSIPDKIANSIIFGTPHLFAIIAFWTLVKLNSKSIKTNALGKNIFIAILFYILSLFLAGVLKLLTVFVLLANNS